MGIVISPDSEYAKELARWNRPRNVLDSDGKPGFGPIGYEHFPLMLYKAFTRENGKRECMTQIPTRFIGLDAAYAMALIDEAEAFNKSCQLICGNQQEVDRAKAQGWRETPQLAVAYLDALEKDMADAAAEAAHAAQRMTDKAKRELAAADAATSDHVSDVTPKTKR